MRSLIKIFFGILLGTVVSFASFAEFKFSTELGGLFNPSNIWAEFRFGYQFPLKSTPKQADRGVFLFVADRVGVGLNDFWVGVEIDPLSFLQISAEARLRTLYLVADNRFLWASGLQSTAAFRDKSVYLGLIYRAKVNLYFSKKIFYVGNSMDLSFHDMGSLNPANSVGSFRELETDRRFNGSMGLLFTNQTLVSFRFRLLEIGVVNEVLYSPLSSDISDKLGGILGTRSSVADNIDFFFRLEVGAYVYDKERFLDMYGRTNIGLRFSF